jgi:hypothetical protein
MIERWSLAAAILLGVGAAQAADGTYTGGTSYISGSGTTCQGVEWKLTVTGNQVRATALPTGTIRARTAEGSIEPDGKLVLEYTAGPSGVTRLEGKFEGDKFVGRSQSSTCAYNVTLSR